MKVDVEKYYGRWHELARLPNWFQGDSCWVPLVGREATAFYSPSCDPGKINVKNDMKLKIKILESFNLPKLHPIFGQLNFFKNLKSSACGEAKIIGENSFSVSFDFFSKFFTFGKPNYFVRTLLKEEDDSYLFSVVTSSEKNEEQKFAWLLSKKPPKELTQEELVLAKTTLQMMEHYGVKEEKLIKHSIFT